MSFNKRIANRKPCGPLFRLHPPGQRGRLPFRFRQVGREWRKQLARMDMEYSGKHANPFIVESPLPVLQAPYRRIGRVRKLGQLLLRQPSLFSQLFYSVRHLWHGVAVCRIGGVLSPAKLAQKMLAPIVPVWYNEFHEPVSMAFQAENEAD
jgi:hypothetical protein